MTSSYYVYCDEYGNTGARLDDIDQPMFLYAFVSIAEEEVSVAASKVGALYRRGGTPLTELKSSTLIQSSRGRRRYCEVGEILSESGARLNLSAVEKRYQACAMLVETFLDPHLNPRAPRELLQPSYRQRMANALYDGVNDDALRDFVASVLDDDPARIAESGVMIGRRMQFHPDDFVANIATLMETRPESIFRYLSPGAGVSPGFRPWSQTFGFYGGLQIVDADLEAINSSGIVIRDDDRQAGKWLDVAHILGRETGPDSQHAYGTFRRLERIIDCRPADSKTLIGLQFADLAAGIFGRAMSSALRGARLRSELSDVLSCWAGLLTASASGYWTISDKRMNDVLRSLDIGAAGRHT